jgi:endoglucanase
VPRKSLCLLMATFLATTVVTSLTASASGHPVAAGRTLAANTRFYVDPDGEAAHQALADLRAGRVNDAVAMAELATWPEAAWFTKGTPAEVHQQVSGLTRRAARQHAVPVLVAYDIPLRDCSQFSAGGAQSDAAYRQWIAAFADALGSKQAVVILEPDALANLPSDCSATTDPSGAITAARIADLRYAVGVLEAQPRTSVYLDAGHSQWHSVGDMAARLIQADVAHTQGFFLNVSNFQPTDQGDEYGTWLSKCLWYATAGPGDTASCASQYFPATASDPSTWHLTDEWYAQHVDVLNPPASALTHFVVDTSRNGQGAWTPPAGKYTGDAQTWCNPPERGVGPRPTAATTVPLVDAYLFVKTIGESDGQCTRGTAGPGDPEYGNTVDPVAGGWWPAQALTLVHNAAPRLTVNPRLWG